MAEAVLKHQVTQRPSLSDTFDIVVDSAGTGAYHEGDDADERCVLCFSSVTWRRGGLLDFGHRT
jgi:protein-tyrosine-phosphatase